MYVVFFKWNVFSDISGTSGGSKNCTVKWTNIQNSCPHKTVYAWQQSQQFIFKDVQKWEKTNKVALWKVRHQRLSQKPPLSHYRKHKMRDLTMSKASPFSSGSPVPWLLCSLRVSTSHLRSLLKQTTALQVPIQYMFLACIKKQAG